MGPLSDGICPLLSLVGMGAWLVFGILGIRSDVKKRVAEFEEKGGCCPRWREFGICHKCLNCGSCCWCWSLYL